MMDSDGTIVYQVMDLMTTTQELACQRIGDTAYASTLGVERGDIGKENISHHSKNSPFKIVTCVLFLREPCIRYLIGYAVLRNVSSYYLDPLDGPYDYISQSTQNSKACHIQY